MSLFFSFYCLLFTSVSITGHMMSEHLHTEPRLQILKKVHPAVFEISSADLCETVYSSALALDDR